MFDDANQSIKSQIHLIFIFFKRISRIIILLIRSLVRLFIRSPSPQMSFVLRHLHHADAPSQASVVHRAAQPPLILFRVVNFDRFEIRRAVETADSVQLPIDHSQPHLDNKKTKFEIQKLIYHLLNQVPHLHSIDRRR